MCIIDCLNGIPFFINLRQLHNFTVSAQDIFTFRRRSVFTVSLQEFSMEIIKRFVPSSGYGTEFITKRP